MLTKTNGPAGYAQPKTIDVPLSELFLAAEAPKGVNLTVRDSGSGSPLTDAELRASIYTNGILVPLIYKIHGGKKYVIAGNRRLTMLRAIYEGDKDATAPGQNVADYGADYDGARWRQIAIDTNLSLPPHIVERYEQIVLLSQDLKLSPEDARVRFGLTARQFDQVMALGKMAPTVREAWKQGAIDVKTAQAFTLEPDTKEQEKILTRAQKEAHNGRIGEWDVRRRIIPQNTRELGKLVEFVGIDACKKAKIIKQEDLFSSDHIVSDAKALNKLVGDKLAAARKQLLDAGWSWTLMENELDGREWSYGTLTPATKAKADPTETAELDRLQRAHDDDEEDDAYDKREALEEAIKQRGFSDAQRAKSGCILKILQSGKLSVSYGRTKPEEQRKTAAANASTSKPKAKAKAGVPVLTNALAERLSVQLQTALRDVMKKSPRASVAALIAAIASGGEVVDISAGGRSSSYEERSKRITSFTSVFEGALKAQPEAQLAMLMSIAAEALSIKTFNAEHDPLKDTGLLAVVAALPAKDVSAALKSGFDAKDYFAGVPLATIVEAVRCACGEGASAEVAKMKKAAAADFAAKHVPGTGWLPSRLRTVHYSGPVESAAKKPAPAKPKPAKKKSNPERGLSPSDRASNAAKRELAASRKKKSEAKK